MAILKPARRRQMRNKSTRYLTQSPSEPASAIHATKLPRSAPCLGPLGGLVGAEVVSKFKLTGFFVPGVHSRPLSDDDPDIAPELVALRRTLMEMVRRPVNIQASLDLVLYLRGDLLGQPYLTIIDGDRDS